MIYAAHVGNCPNIDGEIGHVHASICLNDIKKKTDQN